MADLKDCWDLAGRDVVPDLTALGAPRDVGAALLVAMLQSDGSEWAPDYEEIRRRARIRKKLIEPEREEQANSRIRTWMTFFRSLGLVYDSDGRLRVTEAGARLHQLLEDAYSTVDDFAQETSRANRWRLARLVGPVLARYQLRTPATADDYPIDTNIQPLWALWKAMRELDNRIHWEEVGRVLTRCLRVEDLPGSIEKIRAAREDANYDPNDKEYIEATLGPRCPDLGDDQQDRIIVWLSRAAFKDVFLEIRNRTDGYRYLQAEFVPLLDELLAKPPEYKEFADSAAYYQYLGAAPEPAVVAQQEALASSPLTHTIVERCRQVGDRMMVALIGPAGTGKTALAREAAMVLANSDPNCVCFVQFHAAFSYEQFIGGLAPTPAGGFEPADGVLVRFNKRAAKDSGRTYVMVLDELSRADVGNVLGELLTYIEYRDVPFAVPALGRDISLARNLVVIATLNPQDRSVINLDDAVVRRLRQVEVPRSTAALLSITEASGMNPSLSEKLVAWFDGLPDDAPFGHGLFVGVSTEDQLHRLWHEQLQFFLKRGGVSTYHSPSLVEDGYVWRRPEFADGLKGAAAPSVEDPVAGDDEGSLPDEPNEEGVEGRPETDGEQ